VPEHLTGKVMLPYRGCTDCIKTKIGNTGGFKTNKCNKGVFCDRSCV